MQGILGVLAALVLFAPSIARSADWKELRATVESLAKKRAPLLAQIHKASVRVGKMKQLSQRVTAASFAKNQEAIMHKREAFEAARKALVAALEAYRKLGQAMVRVVRQGTILWRALKAKSAGAGSSNVASPPGGSTSSASDPNGDAAGLMAAGGTLSSAASNYTSAGDAYWPPAVGSATSSAYSTVQAGNTAYQSSRKGVTSAGNDVSSVNNLLQSFK
jgi:hypothetical protein